MGQEVLAPAGGLDHALWALEGGANAVYFGFQKFSARSHAANFDLEQVRQLAKTAREKQARLYAAVNTILTSTEVAEAVELAWNLHWCGVDALILQDLGVAKALQATGLPMALHASTQAAVHTPDGVRAVRDLGFSRVVLARELTLSEIERIVQADPQMEYEVFVHGALCYAVSGNCMASGLMIGRSANKGDCGQVCRTSFELDYLVPGPHRRTSPHEEGLPQGIHAPEGEQTWQAGTKGAFASMNDLELGPRVRQLAALGVQSFKIEGRMKPPAYSYYTSKAYRAFLEGHDDEGWVALDEARLGYGRRPSAGWLDGHKALAQINPQWAGTLGLPLGEVRQTQGSTLVLQADKPKASRLPTKGDGVLVLGTTPGQSFRTSVLAPTVSRPPVWELTLAKEPPFSALGASVWLTSRHDGKLPLKKASRSFQFPLTTKLQMTQPAPGVVQLSLGTTFGPQVHLDLTLPCEPSSSPQGLETALHSAFLASSSRFIVDKLELDVPVPSLFINPRELKQARRTWLEAVEAEAKKWAQACAQQVLQEEPPLKEVPLKRSQLNPLEGVNRLLGFIVEWERLTPEQLAPTPWGLALPLAPFTPNEEEALGRLRRFLSLPSVQNYTFLLGINNPAHLVWLKQLRKEGFDLKSWFADWGFHRANGWLDSSLNSLAPGQVFSVGWLEQEGSDTSYTPPLFTSRACMLRNSFSSPSQTQLTPTQEAAFDARSWSKLKLQGRTPVRSEQGPRCPAGCSGHFSAHLTQGKQGFRVEARDCVNYLLLEKLDSTSV